MISAQMLASLACPACYASLLAEGEAIRCTGCRRLYPVLDGIPILIVDRAQPPG